MVRVFMGDHERPSNLVPRIWDWMARVCDRLTHSPRLLWVRVDPKTICF